MKKITDFKIGDSASIEHEITEQDIQKFVDLTGDDNKLHLDKEFASRTSFKNPVVHGMIGASFISTIIGTKLPGDGALWLSQSIEYLLPVRIGDRLVIKAEIIAIIESQNLIELGVEILNQYKQAVTKGICKIKLIEIEQKAEMAGIEQELPKTALVIGATGGIGKATCVALARKGFDVIIHYNSKKEAALKLKSELDGLGIKTIIVQADVKDILQVKSMFENINRHLFSVTVLVNCSTCQISGNKFEKLEWQDIQNQIDVNIMGSFFLMKEVLPIMVKQKYGKIINLTTLAVDSPNSEWLGYITAKSALEGFSKSLASEFAPKGVRINLVSPGMTETDLILNIPEKAKLIAGASTPLRRIALPEDVANAICFLATKESDFLAGETIRVNGGKIMI